MNRLVVILLLFASLCWSISSANNVLFVGDSYTFRNNLDILFHNLWSSSNISSISASRFAESYYNFEEHLTAARDSQSDLHHFIYEQQWSHIVWQDQSFVPACVLRSNSNQKSKFEDSLKSILELNKITRSTASENYKAPVSVLYQTWARRDNYQLKSWLEFSNFDSMQDAVTQGYAEYAATMLSDMNSSAFPTNEVMVAPVGEIWRQIYHSDSSAPVSLSQLFNDDGTHPSLHGSYLAACTIFAAISRRSPVGLWYPTEITLKEASYLQELVRSYMNISSNVGVSSSPASSMLLLRQKLCSYAQRK